MAAPSYVTASTGTTDATGAWSHTAAAPGAAGRILIVQVIQDGTAASPTISSVTNAEDLAGTDNTLTFIGEFDVGSAVAASQHLWIGRSLSTSAMVITGANSGGDDVYVRVYEFKDVNVGTAITDVIENGTAGATANGAGTGTTISDTGVTTLGSDRLALQFVGANDDIAVDSFAGETGGDWAEPVAEYADSGGTDGMVQLQASSIGPSFIGIPQAGVGAAINGDGGTSEMAGMSFDSGAGGAVSSVSVNLFQSASPADQITVEIHTDSAGVPSGTAVGTGSTATPVAGWNSFAVSATLSASTTYHVVVSRTGARDTTNRWNLTQSSAAYAGGVPSLRASGSWSASGVDKMFAVHYSAGGTINGGSDAVVSAGWGVVGFALIGTTASGNTYTKAGYGKESG